MFKIPTRDEVEDFVLRHRTEIAYTSGAFVGSLLTSMIYNHDIKKFSSTHYSVRKSDFEVDVPNIIGNKAASQALVEDGGFRVDSKYGELILAKVSLLTPKK